MIGDSVGRVTCRVDEEGGTVNATDHVCSQRSAFGLALLFVLFDASHLDVTAGARVGAIRLCIAHGCGTVGGFETDHTLQLGDVVSSLSALLLFNVVDTFAYLCAATDDAIEFATKEASADPDHGDTDG